MARPRIFRKRQTLNLNMEADTKRRASILAFKRNVSISHLVADLVNREHAALEAAETKK